MQLDYGHVYTVRSKRDLT